MWVVRSEVSCGNESGIGLREERVGRSVDTRSRCLSFGKIMPPWSGGDESDVRGFALRERVWRLGRAVSGPRCERVVKALEERSNFVRSGVLRDDVISVRLLEARERVVNEGNRVVKFLIWIRQSAQSDGYWRNRVRSQIPMRDCRPERSFLVARNQCR